MSNILKLARENCSIYSGEIYHFDDNDMERFAALIVAEERKRIQAKNEPEIARANAYIANLESAAKTARAEERKRCAKVADEHAKRKFSWASENADIYHAQADWAERIAAAIRGMKDEKD